MLYVRWSLRTPITRSFERCVRRLFHRSPEKNFGKTVRGAPILCYGLKKKQHLCQAHLTDAYADVLLLQQLNCVNG